MKIVIEIDDEQVLFDIRNRGLEAKSETDKVIIDALYNGTPLPEHHGRIIDESKITSVYYHEENYDRNTVRCYHTVIDGTDAPTIIEGSESE